MTDKLVVYTYNVLFGDAILVEVPDGSSRRFILIDVGNVLSGEGGKDQPLLDAARDIRDRTGGKIDLYVMTHEHMDHVQGLLYAKKNGCEFQIDTVWMTVSSDPHYYETHEKAREKRLELQRSMAAFQGIFAASEMPAGLAAMLSINNPKSTDDCVDCIRKAVPEPYYVYRGFDTSGKHPFTEAAIRILAPEEDSSVYYGPVPPRFDLQSETSERDVSAGRPMPLPGIDGGAFYRLIDNMNGACAEGVYAIDQAANNTSVVFELTWRGNRLLFTGDAELKSWQLMDNKTALQPVDFIKIGHHGSCNAAPKAPILEKILPKERQHEAVAVVSYFPGTYSGVPDPEALAEIGTRTSILYKTVDIPPGTPVAVTLQERS
jgi:beta-lactamase superfamily II metal-dependent hydrolase